jgi:hypothetical protein
MKTIVLVGLGPHARRIYYPLIEKYAAQYDLHIPLIIDLIDQAAVLQEYLAGRTLHPDRLLLLDREARNRPTLDPAALEALARIPHIDVMIIATEAKAHKPYAIWALDRNIDILMDKPISAPLGAANDSTVAAQIMDDYELLANHLARSRSNFIVQCQRRSHAGYRFIHDYLRDFISTYCLPISYMDIYHADGAWNMPDELFQKENHPYKYGYGKLMHSGYHFIDLFCWLIAVNAIVPAREQMELFVRQFNAHDFLQQMTPQHYRKLFGEVGFESYFDESHQTAARAFGELDTYILAQIKADGAVRTTASINLQQNSFSRRAWSQPARDVYKGNGRVRHERVTLQVATLLCIQVHSYQAYEIGKMDVETQGAGNQDHFDVYIYRNRGVIGGKAIEKISFGEQLRRESSAEPGFLGHNEKAREVHFLNLLNREPGESHFLSHRKTNLLLSQIYAAMANERRGQLPYQVFDF